MTVISEDLLSRGQAGKIRLKVPACPRARRNVEKLVSPCHRVTVNTEQRMLCIALLLWTRTPPSPPPLAFGSRDLQITVSVTAPLK